MSNNNAFFRRLCVLYCARIVSAVTLLQDSMPGEKGLLAVSLY